MRSNRSSPATPRLVADRAALTANIAAMAAYAAQRRVALRPHAKTHKSPDIARLQVASGAVGISCATVAEMEAMASARLPGLLLTSAPVTAEKARRVLRLHKAGHEVAVVADSMACLSALQRANKAGDRPLPVLIDIDLGHRRTGTRAPSDSLVLAQQIMTMPGLLYRGVQGYAGHAQHIVGAGDRRRAAENAAACLRAHIDLLRSEGFEPAIVSGSGSGCFADDMKLGLYTEYQVGSYAVMDTEYGAIERANGPVFAAALFVEATVIGDQFDEFVLVDAGQKALFRGGPLPVVAGDFGNALRYEFAGDEHGRLFGPRDRLPRLGARVRFVLPHCDPNVALFDHIAAEDGSGKVVRWPVKARGIW
jgi:D-serine deaminase-like pyridoxal phosphate-dependent protein